MSTTMRRAGIFATAGLLAAGGTGALASGTEAATHAHAAKAKRPPIEATVFSPRRGERSGRGGVGFIVDVALDANTRSANRLIGAKAGYKPLFRNPMAPDYAPGTDPGAPGLVVMLSSTPTMPGTAFKGPRTNLAGLFQINGVATVKGLAQTWNTWQPSKPLFGTGKRATLTVYAVKGTAPAEVPAHGVHKISNTVRRTFTVAR